MRDPVSTTRVLAALRELRPGVPVAELADVGHYVQIERPDLVAAAIAELAGPADQAA
jgi:pimeloyl-ACP methyl ester carboxylesterase